MEKATKMGLGSFLTSNIEGPEWTHSQVLNYNNGRKPQGKKIVYHTPTPGKL